MKFIHHQGDKEHEFIAIEAMGTLVPFKSKELIDAFVEVLLEQEHERTHDEVCECGNPIIFYDIHVKNDEMLPIFRKVALKIYGTDNPADIHKMLINMLKDMY